MTGALMKALVRENVQCICGFLGLQVQLGQVWGRHFSAKEAPGSTLYGQSRAQALILITHAFVWHFTVPLMIQNSLIQKAC